MKEWEEEKKRIEEQKNKMNNVIQINISIKRSKFIDDHKKKKQQSNIASFWMWLVFFGCKTNDDLSD